MIVIGKDIMTIVVEGAASPHYVPFWKMEQQTALRQGNWKLVLDGHLIEGAEPEDDVHLVDLYQDIDERQNRKDESPDVVPELIPVAKQ